MDDGLLFCKGLALALAVSLSMARLPSKLDLSGPESLRSGRTIASYDTSAIGRGLANLGADVTAIAKERQQQQDVVDVARAEAEKTKGLLATQNEFDNDPDYATYSKRAPVKTSEVVKKAGDLIRNPKMRERWLIGAQSDADRTNDGIFDRGTSVMREAETVAFDEALETNRRIYVDPETGDDAKAKARADIEGAIQSGLATGLLDPSSAEARRKAFIEDADFSRGKLAVERDPSIISKPLPKKTSERVGTAMGYFQSRGYTKEQAAGIVGNLLAESSLDTGARNGGDGADGSDSIGIGQWNSGRAKALKEFAALNKADWRDFGIQLAFVDHELRNSEKSAGDSLRSAKDVKSATEAMIMYERPAGSQNGAANAHNYSGRLKFAAQAAGQEVNPDWYERLSPEQKQVVQSQAETRQNQIAVESRAAIEVATTNAPVAILNTGAYTGDIPSSEEFFAAYGPLEGAERFNNFVASMQTSEQAHSMRTMSASDIEAMVEEARPTSTGDSAALEQKRYDTLTSAAETTLKAREADPAAYAVQTFPKVGEAWDAANTPEGFQSAVASSVAAQQQLGIKDVRPLPKEIATTAVEGYKNVGNPEADRIASVANIIMATLDAGQRRILFDQLVDAGLPDITEGAFEAMSRGDDGAAKRLFQAAMVDPSKLPGSPPEKPAVIDEAIQDQLMAEGSVGDIYYGLGDGTSENFARAERDAKLISNSVNLRMRNGETLDQAIAGVSKDLYGDVVPVSGDSRVNAQILVPAGQDPDTVLDGLEALQPAVKEALGKAMILPGAGPAGTPAGLVEAGNIDLAARPVVANEDGTTSTVRSMSFEEDGAEVLIPTVSDDGRVLSDEDAIALYRKTGQHLGKFKDAKEATVYAEALHSAQEAFYERRASGTAAVMKATTSAYVDNVMSEGFFRNSEDGFVFIDPFVGAAISDETGKPIIFKPIPPKPSEGRRNWEEDGASRPLTDDDFTSFQKRLAQ